MSEAIPKKELLNYRLLSTKGVYANEIIKTFFCYLRQT